MGGGVLEALQESPREERHTSKLKV
jgi:hypothetical protein